MASVRAIESLLRSDQLVIADVGAAYGLPEYLRVLERWATVCLFEPNRERAQELRTFHQAEEGRKNVHVFETALSGTGGPQTLYETHVPTGSSLLKPGSNALYEFGDPEYFFPVRERSVVTRRLDQVLDEAGIGSVDFIKLDVQGAEVAVLQGLGDRLGRSMLGIELEVGLPGGYLGQPSIGTVDSFLREQGFILFDIRPVRLHRAERGDRTHYPRTVFQVHESSDSLSKRIWEADAVYFRDPQALLTERDEAALRRLTVLYCAYGFFVEAYALMRRAAAEECLTDAAAAHLQAAIVEWHRDACYCFTESPTWWRFKQFLRYWERRLLRAVCGRRSSTWLFNES